MMTSAEWTSIRPWAPRLSLSVREITSVSVTFILSSSLSSTSSPASDDDEPDSEDSKQGGIISEALTKGLSVSVNGTSWPRVLIRVDEKVDEAVIIIYSLMPGRQYDVELGLVQNGQSSNVHSQVITEGLESQTTEEDASPSPISETHSHTTPSTSPSHTPPPVAPLTLDDHLNHLQHTLSLLTSERDSLTTTIKSTRRDAQKSDAALRSEIDILKKSSEKHSVAEHRAKQKVLALQESVKRATGMTRDAEKEAKEVQKSLPGLRQAREEKEREYQRIKELVDRKEEEEERQAEKERRRLELMKAELAGLTSKLEKLNAKKEKLESGTIPDFEEQLRELQSEIEKVEEEPIAQPPKVSSVSRHKPLSSRAPPFEPGRGIVAGKQVLPTPIQRPKGTRRPSRGQAM